MIKFEILKTSVPFADKFTDAGINLRGIAGSPLDRLVEDTPNPDPFNDATAIEDILEGIANNANSENPITGDSFHTQSMDILSKDLASHIESHYIFAKNTVAPLAANLANDVIEYLSGLNSDTIPTQNISVIDTTVNPLTNEEVYEELGRYRNIPLIEPLHKVSVGSLSDEEILARLDKSVTSARLHDDVCNWAKSLCEKEEGCLASMFDSVYRSSGDQDNTILKALNDLDKATLTYFLADSLIEDIPNGTIGSNDDYIKFVKDIKGLAARNAFFRYGLLKQKVSGDILVDNVNGNNVTVYKSSFDKYIESGGTTEAILALTLNENQAMGTTVRTSTILENQERLKSSWRTHLESNYLFNENYLFTTKKEAITSFFIKNILKNLVGIQDDIVRNENEVYQRFTTELNKFTFSDLDDIYTSCLKLVCRSCFPKSDVEKILMTYERVARANKDRDLQPREIAAIAQIDRVAQWIADQVTV